MRLGIFGGSFDPVHYGHLTLAQACHQQAALDEVWFMPTAVQPLKQHGPHATNQERVEMLQLAIDDHSNAWRVCTLEIDRGGLSYTVDTVRQLHAELPDAKLFFMIGADAMQDVPHWKEPAEIFGLATPLVVRRCGQPDPNLALLAPLCSATNQPQLVEMPAVDVSSSTIRARVAAGESIDGLVSPSVAEFISRYSLYR